METLNPTGDLLDLRPQEGIDRTKWITWKPTQPTPRPPERIDKAQLENIKKMEMVGDEKGMRRTVKRRTVDYGTPLIRWQYFRKNRISPYDMRYMRPNPNFVIDLFTPNAYPDNASISIATKFVHTSTNKVRCPVNVVRWTPDGRRLLTGSSSGEFTLWNGLTFNFETILQAHDTAVRSMSWSHSEEWLVSGDHGGIIKYWQPNMNNLNVILGHREAVRDVTFCPNDTRFATASDDGSVKIWDFNMGREERDLKGHGWDVKCVDWHPSKGLLVSGSKDNLIKFWDPRSGKALATLHGHKNTVMSTKWSVNGDFMASVSRDQTVKVYDLRTMKEYATLRGHKKEVNSVTWHPVHTKLLVTGGSEGSILYWILDQSEEPVGSIDFAHESNVWSLAWHPIGHLLCSGSNDHTTRFWSRNRPGEELGVDRWSIGREKAEQLGIKEDDEQNDDDFVPGLRTLNGPGPGIEGNGVPFGGQAPWGNNASSIPGLDGGIPGLDGRGPPQNRYRQQGGYGDRYQEQDRNRYGGQGSQGGRGGGGWQNRQGTQGRNQQGSGRGGGNRYNQGGGGGYGGGGGGRRY